MVVAHCRHNNRIGALGTIMATKKVIDRNNDNGGEGCDNCSNEKQRKKRLEEKVEVLWEISFFNELSLGVNAT